MKFTMTQPCDKCPFRSDKPGYLRAGRVKEICRSLLAGRTFACHETTIPDEDDDASDETMREGPNTQHCAGALIFLEQQDAPNQLMRIAERLGTYDRRRLSKKVPVFQSADAMARAQDDYEEAPEGETCAIVGPECEAPAGYMTANGVVDGDVFIETICPECGEYVCDPCMDSEDHPCSQSEEE